MINHLLMLTCGWVGGVVSTLLIRHMLDGRRPLEPALLPTSVPMPRAARLVPPPPVSPYAPKKVLPKPAQRREQLVRVWRAAKQDRPTTWVRATDLLPSIAWGQPHGGEGVTRTQEVRAQSAALRTGIVPKPLAVVLEQTKRNP